MNRYDRRLARAVYAMVLLAILAMVLAEGAVVYFALASLAALISWPIAHGPSGQSAVPRWLISLAVLLALLFFLFELSGGMPLVSALAHFMIFVQVCKFFETKRARDYGQLIVLSMLEMVVAAILSSSMLFAVILVVYLALSIYALLLFHFKREMELFERPGSPPGRVIGPLPGALASAVSTLNGLRDGRFWRISASTGAFALAVGVVLFLCFPRIGQGLWTMQTSMNPVTGFSENPRLDDAIGQIKESDALVMWVTVLQNGRRVQLDEPLRLRGITSWSYVRGRWERPGDNRRGPILLGRTDPISLDGRFGAPRAEPDLEYRVDLGPMVSQVLFAPYPPRAIHADGDVYVHYDTADRTFYAAGTLVNGLRYTVWSGQESPPTPQDRRIAARILSNAQAMPRLRDLAGQWTEGRTDRYAVASAIQSRLLNDFRYTLRLPGPDDPLNPSDPLEVFLFKTRAGHCQFFASAMTVLCQQVGVPARMVSGFKSVEYNPQGGYYIVRQRHAHSWVEVFLEDRGWVVFDPTPGAGDNSFDTPGGLFGWFAHTLDYMNYKWQQRVLNYSRQDRQAVLGSTRAAARRAWDRLGEQAGRLTEKVSSRGLELAVALVGMVAVGVALRRGRPWRRWSRLRRQRALRDRGLGFWADLLALLDRRRMTPSEALTPLEVADELSRRVPDVPGLRRLALRYYQVRYGSVELTSPERQDVQDTLALLQKTLCARR